MPSSRPNEMRTTTIAAEREKIAAERKNHDNFMAGERLQHREQIAARESELAKSEMRVKDAEARYLELNDDLERRLTLMRTAADPRPFKSVK
jgi:hypothetical protein